MARLTADTLDAIRGMETETGEDLSADTWDDLENAGSRRWDFWHKLSRSALIEVLEMSARQQPGKRLSRHLRGLADAGRVSVTNVRLIHDKLIAKTYQPAPLPEARIR